MDGCTDAHWRTAGEDLRSLIDREHNHDGNLGYHEDEDDAKKDGTYLGGRDDADPARCKER